MKTCFVNSPIGDQGSEVRKEMDDLLELIIQPVCGRLGYDVVRADSIARSTFITRDIIDSLLEADIVITDLTLSNPNVMYELGIRHAVSKPTIIMIRKGERIPFDLATLRVILYDLHTPRDVTVAGKALEEFIKYYETEDAYTDSPVTESREFRKFLQRKSTSGDVIGSEVFSLMKAVTERLGSIESQMTFIGNRVIGKEDVKDYSREIFIVHGHDGELKNDLARLLEKLGFTPIILHEQPDRGQTIIQKLQSEGAKVGYAFILHTPDDEGRPRDSTGEPQPRSRQNVIFEHGMFVGRYSQQRVCAIVKEGVEIPSDLSGIVYKRIPKGGGIDSIAFSIIQELRAAGYIVDANKIIGKTGV